MVDAIVVALITGGLSLIGVIITNLPGSGAPNSAWPPHRQ